MLSVLENYAIYPAVIPADTPVEMTIVPKGRAFLFFEGEEYQLVLASVDGDEDYYYDPHSLKRITVKASGGVRTLADAQALVAAGADRIGTSAGVALCEG